VSLELKPPPPVPSSEGFSLIELLVALTIGTVVLVLTHAVFTAVLDRANAVVAARATLDRQMNARRWLRATFLSIDVGTEGDVSFEGRPDRVTFSSWLLTADGWFTRRTVMLARQEDRIVATLLPGEPIVLCDGVDNVAFDYLLEPGVDARWVREWVSPLRAPLAVRLRVQERKGGTADTLLLLVRERG